jgi:hypothetical protein
VEKWVTYGLLDLGSQRGRGQGRGALFQWPHNQLELLLVLLKKHKEVTRSRVLLNIPVGIWLYWGDDFVPLRQVRRAMASWADTGKRRAKHPWQSMARRIVDSVADPASRRPDRELAADLIVELVRDRKSEVADLGEVLAGVVGMKDPAAFTDGERVAQLLLAQASALTELPRLPDEVFVWARAFLLLGQGTYGTDHAQLAKDPRFGALHEAPSFEGFVQRACNHLVSALGLYLTQPEAPGLPDFLKPELWIEGRARLQASAHYEPSRLRIPPWVEGGQIRVDVHIEVDPAR